METLELCLNLFKFNNKKKQKDVNEQILHIFLVVIFIIDFEQVNGRWTKVFWQKQSPRGVL